MGKSSNEVQETSAERTNSEVAMEEWNSYQTEYRPTEMKFIASVTKDQTALKKLAAGRVNADIAQKIGSSIPKGIDPSRAATSKVFTDTADIKGQAMANAQQRVDDRQVAGEQAIVDIGQGKSASAQAGFSSLAQQSAQEAISKALAKQKVNDAVVSGTMTALGAGARVGQEYWGSGTTLGDDIYSGDELFNPVKKYQTNGFSAIPTTNYGPRIGG